MLENMNERFEVGDFVFAKLKGHPHWPATISQIETIHANGHERTKYNVYFYGSHQMSLIKVESIVKYDDHYDFLKKRYSFNPKFLAALEELEADLETRKSYLQSLRECLIGSAQRNLQDKPEDEMFSASEESYHESVTSSCNQHAVRVGSRFSEGYQSDQESNTGNQKFEILSMEKVLFPGTPDLFLIISLGFNEENLQEDFEYIKNELRMMQCYVQLERLPSDFDGISNQSPSQMKSMQMKSPTRRKPDEESTKKSEHMNQNPLVTTYQSLVETNQVVTQLRRRRGKKRRRRTLTANFWNNGPSLAVIAAEAVKRRRQRKKPGVCDETRLLSLRQRNSGPSEEKTDTPSDCSCLPDQCDCQKETDPETPTAIICPICQAQFSSSVDFKQHSFNIHIMGL